MLASFLLGGVGGGAKDIWSQHRIRLAMAEPLSRMKKMTAQLEVN